jgi:hypothetical protein
MDRHEIQKIRRESDSFRPSWAWRVPSKQQKERAGRRVLPRTVKEWKQLIHRLAWGEKDVA